jgi:ATP phosphoribosyltransferase regulatory subunit
VIDLADARVLRGVLSGARLDAAQLQDIVQALADKDASALESLTRPLQPAMRQSLKALLRLYGGDEVLAAARIELPARPLVQEALDQLQWLAAHLRASYPALKVGFDLSDMSGYAYYSGARFAIFGAGCSDALARGGRYDEVGAVFGRKRPAVGFSLDLKSLAEVAGPSPAPTAIRAPWGEDPALRAAMRRLREAGETVLAVLPGNEPEGQAFDCDRELVSMGGQWVLRAIDSPASN